MTVTIEHSKTIDEAKKRIDEGIVEITSSLASKWAVQVEQHWEGDSLHFTARAMMQKITGVADVFPQHVRITVNLPDFLATVAEKVTSKIQKKATHILEDKRA
ncbi:MAG: polyhydroxyalkanoic acid system family protein [Pseudomonadota bacterium]